MRPAHLAARRAERVHLAVGRADVHATVSDGRRRVEGTAAAEAPLSSRAPDQLPGARGERVDVRVVGPEEDAVSGEGDAALDRTVTVGLPTYLARALRERVHVAAPVPHVHEPVRDERRRLARADPMPPADLAGTGRQRYHLAVELGRESGIARRLVQERFEDGPAVDRRRGGETAVRPICPGAPAV